MSHRDAVKARLKGGRKSLAGYKAGVGQAAYQAGYKAGVLRAGIAKTMSDKSPVGVAIAMLDKLEQDGAALEERTEIDELEQATIAAFNELERFFVAHKTSPAVVGTLHVLGVPPPACLLVPAGKTSALEDQYWGDVIAAFEEIGVGSKVSTTIARLLLEHWIPHLTYPGANSSGEEDKAVTFYQDLHTLVETQHAPQQAAKPQEALIVPYCSATFKEPSMLTSARQHRLMGLSGRGPSVRVQARIERQSQERDQHRHEQLLVALKYCIGASSWLLAPMASIKPAESAMPRGNDPAALTELVLKSSRWLLSSQVSQQAGLSNKNPSSTPNKWKRNNTIFAINHNGQDHYPSYALGDDGKPLPIMKEILQVFSGKKVPLKIGLWFCSVNSWLGGVAPKDVIETRPQDVLKAAIQEVTPIEHG